MSELWSAQQREWLDAMGHAVWSMASAETRAAERQPEPSEAGRPASAMREAAALLGDARPSRSAGAGSTPARGTGSDRLMQALLRAAGSADEAVVAGLVGDIAALRGNAAAKRSLWPRLRALRRDRGA